MSGDKCLKIHIGVKCHLASNVTCLLVVKCLWRQLSQTLTGIRGPASKVWATNVLGVKQLESYGGGGSQKFRKVADVIYGWSLSEKRPLY